MGYTEIVFLTPPPSPSETADQIVVRARGSATLPGHDLGHELELTLINTLLASIRDRHRTNDRQARATGTCFELSPLPAADGLQDHHGVALGYRHVQVSRHPVVVEQRDMFPDGTGLVAEVHTEFRMSQRHGGEHLVDGLSRNVETTFAADEVGEHARNRDVNRRHQSVKVWRLVILGNVVSSSAHVSPASAL